MNPYISITQDDEKEMCRVIGVESPEDLFCDVPDSLKLKTKLNLPEGKTELEVKSYLNSIMKKNKTCDDLTCFLGAGSYDHYIPSLVSHITSRSEFYTAYTPYQAEISQGTLQSIFEYQSLICELTGMEVSNASLYDGGTAVVEACMMSCASTRRNKVIVSKSVHPETRQILKTYCHFRGVEVVEAGLKDGETDKEELKSLIDKTVAAVIIQTPNFLGVIEDLDGVTDMIHAAKGLLVLSVDPISLPVLKTPGEWGADVTVGEGQCLGSSMNFGGPYLGFMATSKKHMRKMPGRIVGETTDVDDKKAYVLTLQAREQHIRREKATSNICSNEGLNVLTAAVYMSALGKEGLKDVAYQCMQKSHYLAKELTKNGKYKMAFNKPFFKEFTLSTGCDVDKLNAELLNKGIIGGYNLGRSYDDMKNDVLLCVTEKRTKSEIDNLVDGMEGYHEEL